MSLTETLPAHSPDSSLIRRFFDGIAFRYDFLNQILSFNLDETWRRKSRDFLLETSQQSILDLGMGTGKFIQLFLKNKTWHRAVGLDFAAQMLEKARQELPAGTGCVNGDFHDLPFQPASFDLIVSAFTLRSVQDMPRFLKGVYQLLTPGGRVGLLCLTRPTHFFFKLVYYPYLKFYLPIVGGLVSGNRQAYEFLASSILNFQEPEQTGLMMEQSGFSEVQIRRFTGGAATLIMGRKPFLKNSTRPA